jgi:hypothetical protein
VRLSEFRVWLEGVASILSLPSVNSSNVSTGMQGGQPGVTGKVTRASRPSNPGHQSSSRLMFNTAMNADCGTSTLPIAFIRFFPSACLFSSFFFRLMSPPL